MHGVREPAGGGGPFRTGILATLEAAQSDDGIDERTLYGLLPLIDPDDLESRIWRLIYRQHGGSGTNLTRTEVLELDWNIMELYLVKLEEERQAEAKALRNPRG